MLNEEDFLGIKQENIDITLEGTEHSPESSINAVGRNKEKEFKKIKTEPDEDDREPFQQSADKNELRKEKIKFICKTCDYSTGKPNNLGRHFTIKHLNCNKNVYFQCETCDYKFDLKRDLIDHINREHPGLQCTRCEKCFKFTNSLHEHILRDHVEESFQSRERAHSSNQFQDKHFERFKCLECDYITYTAFRLERHKSLKHKHIDEAEGFKCVICEEKLKTKNSLKSHYESKHSDSKQLKCKEISEILKYFYCNKCDYKSRYLGYLKQHITKRRHGDEHVSKNFKCDKCSYLFDNVTKLKEHVTRKHTPDEELTFYECNECGYKSKTKPDLKKHLQRQHMKKDTSKSRMIKCDHCDYYASTNRTLKRHVFYKHKPDDQIKSSQFDYKTKSNFLLQHLLNIHVKPKPIHKCEGCDFITNDKQSLKQHIIIKHTPEDQINYFSCDQCEYKAKVIKNLRHHVRVHHCQLKKKK